MVLDEFVSAVARAAKYALPTWSIIGLCGTGALAQSPPSPPRTLTLDEALTIAEKTSERVAIASAGVSRADAGRALARSDGLPQLNGAVSYDRTLRSEFEGLFDADSAATPAVETKSISRISPSVRPMSTAWGYPSLSSCTPAGG